uniref:Putative capsid protein n=1 Tax=viral metagenome TaxID=1070528 RepID=A0A6H1ZDX1_9ZZZZ
MAFTLYEYHKQQTDPIMAGVVEEFLDSRILRYLPFKDIDGSAMTYNREESLPGIAFRAINEAYDESTGIINPLTESLKIMGGDADTDKALMKMEKNFGERRASDILMKTKAARTYFDKIFFDGDEASDPKQFDGLNKRLTGNQVITAGTNGANVIENMLDRLIDAVSGRPDALLMGKAMRRQLNNLAKGSTILTVGKDQWGDPVETYAGVPIGIVEEDNDGNTILALDETQGSSSVTGSIYAVRFGINEWLCGIQNEPIEGVDLGEISSKPAFRYRMEWLMGIAIYNSKSAARLKGITAASGIA